VINNYPHYKAKPSMRQGR